MPDQNKSQLAAAGHRLPAERGVGAILRKPIGAPLAQPWFDKFTLMTLRKWFFPTSRLWAAARAAEGSPERFYDAVPMSPRASERARLMQALGKFEAARASVNALEAEWDKSFFGKAEVSPDYLVAVESGRRDRRNDYNATRRLFRFLLAGRKVPLIKLAIPHADDVRAVYGPLVNDPVAAFSVPSPMPEIEVSRKVAGEVGTHYWLRFPSPSQRVGDTVYARVQEPENVENPPTLLFGHGVCVEFDHWHGLVDEVETLVKFGFRVVRPEAPWHGRRVLPGQFGGEQFVGTSPFGPLDLFTAGLREWSVIMNWCRQNTNAPVAMGGSSLGAMMAQLAADVSQHWAGHLRPDALLLITHCHHHEDAVLNGALASIWGIRRAAVEIGWNLDLLHEFLPLLDPGPELQVQPEHIVSVLGRRDVVTPFNGGLFSLDTWGVPSENRFILDRGHFSVPLTMMRDQRPLIRFKQIMDDIYQGSSL